jgi:hypothetical protein
MSFQYVQPQPEEEKKKPPVKMGMIVAVVVGLVVVICVIAGIVFVIPQISSLLAASPSSPVGAEPISYDVPTAREAYVPAVTMIRKQDPGAKLASATGTWTPTIDRALLNNGRTGWTFAFYLPATNQMAMVIVDRVTGPRIANTEGWATAPELLDDQTWQIDSGGAGMNAFIQTCSGTLDAQPASQVQATLTTAAENGWLLWQYQLLAPDGAISCQVSVDASSGQVR